MFEENFDIFFDTDGIADSHIFNHAPIRGMVDDTCGNVDQDGYGRTAIKSCRLTCVMSEIVPVPVVNQECVLDGVTYVVDEVNRLHGVAEILMHVEVS